MGENGSAFRHPVNMITRSDLRWARTVETISEFFLAVSSFLRWFFFLPFVEKKTLKQKKKCQGNSPTSRDGQVACVFCFFLLFPSFFFISFYFLCSLSFYLTTLSLSPSFSLHKSE